MNSKERGFSLFELTIAMGVLLIVVGGILGVVDVANQRSYTEQAKLDMFQEAREFMDQMSRDLHQAGYPNPRHYVDETVLDISPATNYQENAVGIVKVDSGVTLNVQPGTRIVGDTAADRLGSSLWIKRGARIVANGTANDPVVFTSWYRVMQDEGNAAVRMGKWKLVRNYPGPWELYDLEADRTELDDVAARHPDRVREMSEAYEAWAERCGVIPRDRIVALMRSQGVTRAFWENPDE